MARLPSPGPGLRTELRPFSSRKPLKHLIKDHRDATCINKTFLSNLNYSLFLCVGGFEKMNGVYFSSVFSLFLPDVGTGLSGHWPPTHP